jgi:CheY-like chemotaxis protein
VWKLLDRSTAFALLSAVAELRQETFPEQRRTPATMPKPLELEFVLVSSDYATMNAVSGGVKKYGAKFILVPTAEAARDCMNRRKIDGVFVDLEVLGALGVMESIRKGTSNSKAVIFACVAHAQEYTDALTAGANFLLRKPLSEDSIALHITIAKELLERERRRYFRHAVNLPAILKEGDLEQHARLTNLSEGGMAVRTARPLKHSAILDFEFDLSPGRSISGKGQVAWINTEGMAGIILQIFHGTAREHLESWLTTREQLGGREKDA